MEELTQATDSTVTFAFAPGEEVIVRLAGVAVHGIAAGRPLAAALVPAWAIADVAEAFERNGTPHYVLRFTLHGEPCLALADESAVEGTA